MFQKLDKKPEMVLYSKLRLINLGLLIVIFNPLPAGLIYGFALWREKSTQKEGKLIMTFSLIWGAISLALFSRYFGS